MRRFLITSEKFTGQAELHYNTNGVLCKIDCTNTDMDAATVKAFKGAVAAHIDLLGNSFTSGTTVVEANFEVSFKDFYDQYPMKRNRYKAEKLWISMTTTDQVLAFNSLKAFNRYCKREAHWFTACIADKYLRNREFETDWDSLKK